MIMKYLIRWIWLAAVCFCAWKHYNAALIVILSLVLIDTVRLNWKRIVIIFNNNDVSKVAFSLFCVFSVIILFVCGVAYLWDGNCATADDLQLCRDKNYLAEFSKEHKPELAASWVKAVNMCHKDPECDRTLVDKFLDDANTLIRNKRDSKYKGIN